MTTLNIAAFGVTDATGRQFKASHPALAFPPIWSQDKTVGGTSTAFDALPEGTQFVWLHAKVECRVNAGGAAVNTGNNPSMRMGAGESRVFAASAGTIFQVISA